MLRPPGSGVAACFLAASRSRSRCSKDSASASLFCALSSLHRIQSYPSEMEYQRANASSGGTPCLYTWQSCMQVTFDND